MNLIVYLLIYLLSNLQNKNKNDLFQKNKNKNKKHFFFSSLIIIVETQLFFFLIFYNIK